MQVDRWDARSGKAECGRVEHCLGSAEAVSVELGSAEAVSMYCLNDPKFSR